MRHRLRIWLPVAAVVSLVAPALGFLYGLRLVFAILFIDDDVDKAYNAAGDALTLVCLFALVFTVAATASTLTFYRLGRLRDARRTVVLAGIAVLIPALGTLVTYLVLPPIPGR